MRIIRTTSVVLHACMAWIIDTLAMVLQTLADLLEEEDVSYSGVSMRHY